MPNICMAECSKAFAKACFEEKLYGEKNALEAYRKLKDALLQDVTRDRIINSYELNRDHFKDIEEIFIADYKLPAPRGSSKHLSSHDALIIAMASHLGSRGQVTIVTADERIIQVCKSSIDFPRALHVVLSDIV